MNPCFKTAQIRLGFEGKGEKRKNLWGNFLQMTENKYVIELEWMSWRAT